jgi:glycerate dehydrogenase
MLAMPEFRATKCRPQIINTERGGLVDEAALARALDGGLISGTGFDVSAGEPPAEDHPLLLAASRPNLILTPP